VLGSTDSELMFHLALSFGLEKDVPSAISKMVRIIEAIAKENGIPESIWMTLGISDGKSIWGFRYGSDGRCPTLYVSPGVKVLGQLNPEVAVKLGPDATMLVSEPIGTYQDLWRLVPEQGQVLIHEGKVTMKDFHP
jgi:predicted glutamine amidotransferase